MFARSVLRSAASVKQVFDPSLPFSLLCFLADIAPECAQLRHRSTGDRQVIRRRRSGCRRLRPRRLLLLLQRAIRRLAHGSAGLCAQRQQEGLHRRRPRLHKPEARQCRNCQPQHQEVSFCFARERHGVWSFRRMYVPACRIATPKCCTDQIQPPSSPSTRAPAWRSPSLGHTPLRATPVGLTHSRDNVDKH